MPVPVLSVGCTRQMWCITCNCTCTLALVLVLLQEVLFMTTAVVPKRNVLPSLCPYSGTPLQQECSEWLPDPLSLHWDFPCKEYPLSRSYLYLWKHLSDWCACLQQLELLTQQDPGPTAKTYLTRKLSFLRWQCMCILKLNLLTCSWEHCWRLLLQHWCQHSSAHIAVQMHVPCSDFFASVALATRCLLSVCFCQRSMHRRYSTAGR